MENNKTKKRWDNQSDFYNLYEYPFEILFFKKWRNRLFSNLEGDMLEIGVGTGKNLPYYNQIKANVMGIDISERMLSKAKKLSEKLKLKNITLKVMDGEKLDFKDNTFDYVVTSCVFCSIPNPINALKEVKRVLKPEGKAIMLEHMLSRNKSIAFLENILNPIYKAFHGVNINRDTIKNIRSAGLKIVEEKNLALHDVFRKIVAKK